ncbi:Gfo/Idh/MocA family oxidoreductase [bacterium]|nr:Gfo/Idh/MocA family oxidoreductase [bacterium]
MENKRQLTRRKFVQGTIATGLATGGFLSTEHVFGFQSPNDRPVFATIGLRNQGVAITNKSTKFADFAALADVDSKVLGTNVVDLEKRQGKKPDSYNDYRRILDRKDIDAVMIATPDHWHTKIAVEAMLAGKDVYCEKPLTLTIDEGKLIEQVKKKTGRTFQVGTMQRTESSQRFLQAIALVRSGRIGKVKKVTCGIGGFGPSPVIPEAPIPAEMDWDTWLGPAPKVAYRALPEMRKGYGGGVPLYSNCHYAFRNWHAYSGGKLTDWGAHHVDIACWAISSSNTGVHNRASYQMRAKKITPLDYKFDVKYDQNGYPLVDDKYDIAIKYNIKVDMLDGVELLITNEGDNGILFEGTKGRFFVNRGKIVGKPVEELASNPLPANAVENVYGGPVPENHTLNFIEAINNKVEPISDVWTHNQMLEICHLSNIAMRLGRPLDWDPDKREVIGDKQANTFLSRENRKGYEINM